MYKDFKNKGHTLKNKFIGTKQEKVDLKKYENIFSFGAKGTGILGSIVTNDVVISLFIGNISISKRCQFTNQSRSCIQWMCLSKKKSLQLKGSIQFNLKFRMDFYSCPPTV